MAVFQLQEGIDEGFVCVRTFILNSISRDAREPVVLIAGAKGGARA